MKRVAVIFAHLLLVSTMRAGNLTVVVRHLFNGEPLQLNQPVTTPAGERITISRCAYLLSEPSLKSRTDGEWLTSRNWFGFVNAGNNAESRVLDRLPPEKFNAVRFYVGPDAATDKADPSSYPARHPLNPAVNGLHWGWAGGFVYLALEGHLGGNGEGFSYHIAGTNNRMEVTLPVEIDLSVDQTIEIDFHIDRLFAGESPLRVANQNSTHSRGGDEVPRQIKTRAETAFSIRAMHATTAAAPTASSAAADRAGTPFTLNLPRGVPVPDLPADFPLTQERVALGKQLFNDRQLSRDRSQSCASCHDPKFAFADRRRFSVGIDGRTGERNAMPLFNLAWKSEFFWDGRAPSLRQQAIQPIENPIEMHMPLPQLEDRLSADKNYSAQFAIAFGTPGVSAQRIGIALEAFLCTLTSFDSKFDRAMRGETHLTEQEKRGFQLFSTEYDPRQKQFGADCFHCHGGALFTDNQFHNNGAGINPLDTGRARVTRSAADEQKFATPSLRNVALTAPYMHDGRFSTLAEVIEHYDHGVARTATLDPNLAKHPAGGLQLSDDDKRALIAFLQTLTDERFAER
jgi:cytochrome c peroxidase